MWHAAGTDPAESSVLRSIAEFMESQPKERLRDRLMNRKQIEDSIQEYTNKLNDAWMIFQVGENLLFLISIHIRY